MITPQQLQQAIDEQHQAAHDPNPQVRLVAGPGTGKSYAIGERVRWLLESEVSPDSIYITSFTRAASRDLRRRIRKYCDERGQAGAELVHVSTVHSLALSALRAAGFIEKFYPVPPQVLDDWESKEIYDAEFACVSDLTPGRCKSIRLDYEAFCNTGTWNPANFVQPTPPISEVERGLFREYHGPRTQTYACVLPGEIVRLCVQQMQSGLLDPAAILRIQHLIVDEFQDLNPIDIDFVYRLIRTGVRGFVAGDDDQSIYAFRYASPSGIQEFKTQWPDSNSYTLSYCFRCTPTVLNAATSLIGHRPLPNRIPKNLSSLWEEADPPVIGSVHYWRFGNHIAEAQAIAESCRELISRGVNPREILILMGNRGPLLRFLEDAFAAIDEIRLEVPGTADFLATTAGRFIHSVLRVVCDETDYVALRSLLGLLPNVGPTTCDQVAQAVISSNLNYRDVFYSQLPNNVFYGRARTAINRLRDLVTQLSDWSSGDTLEDRGHQIAELVGQFFGQEAVEPWIAQLEILPLATSLEEARDYLWADTDEQQSALLQTVYERLNLELPEEGLLPRAVRAMSMHGAKGLDAQVVFIPGLEEGIVPNNSQRRVPGLVLEAARQLYVSITRARVACIVSFAHNRLVYGNYEETTPSRFANELNGVFAYREGGLTPEELDIIDDALRNYSS